jgi:hypothetical protein
MSGAAAGAFAAPDYAEPFVAWRVWRVVSSGAGHRLASVVKQTLWPDGDALVADCLKRSLVTSFRRRHPPHAAPDAACECGIYAGWLPLIGDYLADPPANSALTRVVGQVALWGTVIECERGFRASHAYPMQLYVPVDGSVHPREWWDELAAGLAVYGVPVEMLPARCSQAVDVLAQRQLASADR